MIKLYDNGVYLMDGTEIVEDTGSVSVPVSKDEAAQNTMAYGILKEHNTSSDMEHLQIKFDKLTSHDITFVGIIQTARASGLEKFPVPYVPVSYTHLRSEQADRGCEESEMHAEGQYGKACRRMH